MKKRTFLFAAFAGCMLMSSTAFSEKYINDGLYPGKNMEYVGEDPSVFIDDNKGGLGLLVDLTKLTDSPDKLTGGRVVFDYNGDCESFNGYIGVSSFKNYDDCSDNIIVNLNFWSSEWSWHSNQITAVNEADNTYSVTFEKTKESSFGDSSAENFSAYMCFYGYDENHYYNYEKGLFTVKAVELYGLTDYDIKDGVLIKYNGDGENVVIPEGVTSIGWNAFDGVENKEIQNLYIPSTLTGDLYFDYVKILNSIEVSPDNPKYNSNSDCNAIIETDTGTLVKGCGNTIVPKGVKVIGSYAFYGCSAIREVELPESVETICSYAFNDCSGLESVGFSANISKIEYDAFDGCTALKEIVLPQKLTVVESSAFYGCSALESVVFSENIAQIEGWAFAECTNLTNVVLPESAGIIRRTSFKNTPWLNDLLSNNTNDFLIVGKSILNISKSSKKLVIPEGIKCLDCALPDDITSLILPDTLEVFSIGRSDIISYENPWPKKIKVIENLPAGSYGSGGGFPSTLKKVTCRGSELEFTSCGDSGYGEYWYSLADTYPNVKFEFGTTCVTGVYQDPDGVVLSWSAVKGASKYVVVRLDGGVETEIGETTKTYFFDTISPQDNCYQYTVKAMVDGEFLPYYKHGYTYDHGDSLYYRKAPKIKVENTSAGIKVTITEIGNTEVDGMVNMLRKTCGDTDPYAEDFVWLNENGIDESAEEGKTYIYTVNWGGPSWMISNAWRYSLPITCTKTSASLPNPFTDVANKKYYTDNILYLRNRGTMQGQKTDFFGVGKNLTRAEMITLIWKNEGRPDADVNLLKFTDVKKNSFYSKALVWGNQNGIITGYNSKLFGTNDNITRQDFMVILYRYAKYKEYNTYVGTNIGYMARQDADKVASYAREAVNWGYLNGFIGNGSDLRPTEPISREDAATIMARFLKRFDP